MKLKNSYIFFLNLIIKFKLKLSPQNVHSGSLWEVTLFTDRAQEMYKYLNKFRKIDLLIDFLSSMYTMVILVANFPAQGYKNCF